MGYCTGGIQWFDFMIGEPTAVKSLTLEVQKSTIILSWTPPDTLDIPDNPDILTYCVDLINSTSSTTIASECGINETTFHYNEPARSWCNLYSFIVTAVNIVGNGTATSANFSGTETSMQIKATKINIYISSHFNVVPQVLTTSSEDSLLTLSMVKTQCA